jgi:hypothetical protein
MSSALKMTNDGSDKEASRAITCETTGSCGSTRRAYKQELNKIREEKRKNGGNIEDDYYLMLEGKPTAGKSFSPFAKKQTPQTKS